MTFPDRIAELPRFDGPFDAHALKADRCDVLFASYSAGTVIADHAHETDNHGVITAGELILYIDGRESRHRAGDWYEVPAGTVHSARFDVETSEIELWFQPR